MGADIHMVLEQRITLPNGEQKWVGMHSFEATPQIVRAGENNKFGGAAKKTVVDDYYHPCLTRNYSLFAAIAGVRGSGPAPRGLPEDVSDLARFICDGWGEDGHSHTWLPLREALPLFAGHMLPEVLVTEDRKYVGYWLFGVDNDQMDDYRLIIWFDN